MTWLAGMTSWKGAGGGSAGLGWDNPKFCNEQLLQRVVKSWRLLQLTARSLVYFPKFKFAITAYGIKIKCLPKRCNSQKCKYGSLLL